ncbi:uncharacterized protein YALI1_F11186g [Yarrowia lipolytica]|nr:hypothetical protein YALI1_F11186g [Yarrowia lipolytica]
MEGCIHARTTLISSLRVYNMITGAQLAEHLHGGPLTDAQKQQANATAKKMHPATFSDDVKQSYESIAEGYYAIGRADIASKLESLIAQLEDMRVLDDQPVYHMLKVFLLTLGRPEDQPIKKRVVEVPLKRVGPPTKEQEPLDGVSDEVPFEGDHWNFENEELRGFTDSEEEHEDHDMEPAGDDAISTPPLDDDTGVPLSLQDFTLSSKETVIKTLETEWAPSQITLIRECLFLLQGLECNIGPDYAGHVEQIVEISASLDVLRDVTLQLESSSLPKLSCFVQELVDLMRDIHQWLYSVEIAYLNKDTSGLAVSLNDFRSTVSTRLAPVLALSAILSSKMDYRADPGLLLDAFDDTRSRTLDSKTMKLFHKLYKAVLRDILTAKRAPKTTAAASQAYVHLMTQIYEAQMFALGSNITLADEKEVALEGDCPDELLLNLQVELRHRYQHISAHIVREMHKQNVFSTTLESLSHSCFFSTAMTSFAEWMVQEIMGGSTMWRSQRYINYELDSAVRVHVSSSEPISIIETLRQFHLVVKPTVIQSKGDLQTLSNLWTVLLQVKLSVCLLSRAECANLQQLTKRHANLNILHLVAAFLDFDVCRPLWVDFTRLDTMTTLEQLLGEHSRTMAWLKKHKSVFGHIQQLLLDIESGDSTDDAMASIRKESIIQGTCLALL